MKKIFLLALIGRKVGKLLQEKFKNALYYVQIVIEKCMEDYILILNYNLPIMQKEQKKLNRKFMNAVMEKSVIAMDVV